MNYEIKLKEIRAKKNLTQEDMANIINIARITYNHYETKEKIIPLKRLTELCKYFNLSLDYMFGFTSTPNYQNINYNIDYKIAGARLKKFRKENKISQVTLANFLNTTHSVISEYEHGNTLISTSFLYTISKNYHISADYLLGLIDNPKYLK